MALFHTFYLHIKIPFFKLVVTNIFFLKKSSDSLKPIPPLSYGDEGGEGVLFIFTRTPFNPPSTPLACSYRNTFYRGLEGASRGILLSKKRGGLKGAF
jgi:hypothetical protein